ncbi:MAG: hypothetical protein ABIR71_05860 [Chthoniobacterales bacterium]
MKAKKSAATKKKNPKAVKDIKPKGNPMGGAKTSSSGIDRADL